MDDTADPLLSFFSKEEAATEHLLYSTLGAAAGATHEQLKKAYRLKALRCHPDKHAGKTPAQVEALKHQFQQVGFAWAVLSDEKRRKRYDLTGRTDEIKFDEVSWDDYFSDLFDGVDRKILDDDRKKYQGSEEEREDLLAAYEGTGGDLAKIMERVPHSTHVDEARFATLINAAIERQELEATKAWRKTSKDSAAAEKRKAKAEREAKKAEAAAKELGVYDEFFGDGKKGKRKRDVAEGEASLAALIQKRQVGRANVFSALEAKYASYEEETVEIEYSTSGKKGKGAKKGKGKRKDKDDPLDDAAFEALQAKMFGGKKESPKKSKKGTHADLDEMDDAAFAALQAQMFGKDKAKNARK